MSRQKKIRNNIGKRFIMFVKTLDEDGFVIEDKCGWLKIKPEIELVMSFRKATVFVEKQDGHGSFKDWKELLEEDHPNWRINNTPKYIE